MRSSLCDHCVKVWKGHDLPHRVNIFSIPTPPNMMELEDELFGSH